MQITVTLNLEVDQDAWADEYGCEPARVVTDVENYVANAINQSSAASADCVFVETSKSELAL